VQHKVAFAQEVGAQQEEGALAQTLKVTHTHRHVRATIA